MPAELKRLGFLLVVVTNQPDVARGTQAPGSGGRDARRAAGGAAAR